MKVSLQIVVSIVLYAVDKIKYIKQNLDSCKYLMWNKRRVAVYNHDSKQIIYRRTSRRRKEQEHSLAP